MVIAVVLRYAITDRTRLPGDETARQAALLRQAKLWSDPSVSPNDTIPDLVQLREKDLDAGALAQLARQVLAVFRASPNPPKLLINSRTDVAIAVRADGVHLTSAPGSLTPAQIRQIYSAANLPAPVISLSCHTIAEVARAAGSPEEDRPTLILFGPVFQKVVPGEDGTDTVVSMGTGLELLHQACLAAAPIPVLALGGITSEYTQACLAAGATGIAAIRLFIAEPDKLPSS
jgi:thiamine-phosphate pyrophosphorylase